MTLFMWIGFGLMAFFSILLVIGLFAEERAVRPRR
jgi:hypothetical protein